MATDLSKLSDEELVERRDAVFAKVAKLGAERNAAIASYKEQMKDLVAERDALVKECENPKRPAVSSA